MLSVKKLEDHIIKHWTDYISPREIIEFLKQSKISNPQNIKLSRCEFDPFLMWFSFTTSKDNKTLEVIFDNNGNVTDYEIA